MPEIPDPHVQEASAEAERNEPQAWPTQAESLKHAGEWVSVYNAETGAYILTGRVVSFTDLLGTGGVLEPDPERGMNNVRRAIRFPQDPDEYSREIGKLRFRVEPEAA